MKWTLFIAVLMLTGCVMRPPEIVPTRGTVDAATAADPEPTATFTAPPPVEDLPAPVDIAHGPVMPPMLMVTVRTPQRTLASAPTRHAPTVFAPPATEVKTYSAYAGIEYPTTVSLGSTFDITAWIRWKQPDLPTNGSIKVSISEVHVTPLMKVTLAADSSALVIEEQSTQIQHVPLELDGSTDWAFKLRALKSGKYVVTAHFSYVTTDGGIVALAESYDQTRTVEVQVLSWRGRVSAWVYRLKRFYNSNTAFKWAVNSLGGLLSGFVSIQSLRKLWAWIKKKL